jgi:hypothetical protein
MSHNTNNYIKRKFKVMFGNMKSPTLYAELHNNTYTKTFVNDNNVIVSDFITKDEYAAALGYILLRENGYKFFENKQDNDNTIQ